MRPAYLVAALLAIAGAVICAGVALHEWSYYQDHPFRTGVSGVLTWLAAGGCLGCIAVAILAVALGREAARPDAALVERIMR